MAAEKKYKPQKLFQLRLPGSSRSVCEALHLEEGVKCFSYNCLSTPFSDKISIAFDTSNVNGDPLVKT